MEYIVGLLAVISCNICLSGVLCIMKKLNWKQIVKDYSRILIGTFLSGFGIAVFANPARITGGGVTGIGTILFYTLGIDQGIVMICLNIPLFLLGLKVFGSRYGLKVLTGTLLLSVWTSVIGRLTGYSGLLDYSDSVNILLSALCYGVISGGGIGLVMRAGANTGGSDIIAQIIARHVPFSVGNISFAINCCVMFAGMYFFGLARAIFAFIAMFVSSRMVNMVVVTWGTSLAKTAYIFSRDHTPDIARRVINDIHHGGTLFTGTGIYSAKRRDMLMVVVHNHQLQLLEKIVHEEDPTAFLFINETYQVLGNGFKSLERAANKN